MNRKAAQALLENPQALQAFKTWSEGPMRTDQKTYRLAMDWLDALHVILTPAAKNHAHY